MIPNVDCVHGSVVVAVGYLLYVFRECILCAFIMLFTIQEIGSIRPRKCSWSKSFWVISVVFCVGLVVVSSIESLTSCNQRNNEFLIVDWNGKIQMNFYSWEIEMSHDNHYENRHSAATTTKPKQQKQHQNR